MDKVICAARSLLGSWYCVALDATPEKVAACVIATEEDPTYTPEAVPSRLFGGFACGNGDTSRRHVYHAGGLYTYLGDNGPVSAEGRAETWGELITCNPPTAPVGGFVGGGPCCEDAPATATPDRREAE